MGIRTIRSSQGTVAGGNNPQLLYAGSNWDLVKGYGTNDIYWRSRDGSSSSETATGSLRYGNFVLGSKLRLPVAGGGFSNGNLKNLVIKRASDGASLITITLNTLLGGINSDVLAICSVNTSIWSGTEVYFEFNDNDTNTSWAWIGVDLRNIYCFN